VSEVREHASLIGVSTPPLDPARCGTWSHPHPGPGPRITLCMHALTCACYDDVSEESVMHGVIDSGRSLLYTIITHWPHAQSSLVIHLLVLILTAQHFIPLATLHHLLDDVESTDKLSIDNDLREGLASALVPDVYGPDSLGQSFTLFRPCLTSSSLRISNQANSTPFSRSSPTVCLEKPHFGAEGLPFMNSTTLCLFMSSLHRAVISSSVRGREAASGAAGVAEEVAWGVVDVGAVPECWLRRAMSRLVSAPECRAKSV